MKVIQLVVNGFGENCYILMDEATRDCAIVDPGVSDDDERAALRRTIEKYSLHPTHLINTHLHIDHVLGNNFVAREYGLGVQAHKDDEFLGARVADQARMFNLPISAENTTISTYLQDGDEIRVGESTLKVLAVPGHSPGSICLYCPESRFVLTGDALFAGGIGRTDLPGGDYATLIEAIQSKLLTLPDNTTVYPGHGPATTIAAERASNPYL